MPPQDLNGKPKDNIPPTQANCGAKEADNGLSDDQEAGHEIQVRPAKRRKATRQEPQDKTKPKPKPKPVIVVLITGQTV